MNPTLSMHSSLLHFPFTAVKLQTKEPAKRKRPKSPRTTSNSVKKRKAAAKAPIATKTPSEEGK